MNEELPNLDDRTLIESVNKDDLKPLYDTDHVHVFVRDPDDETDDYYAEICSMKNCNIGRLIPKR
jgi:hypothetical protein